MRVRCRQSSSAQRRRGHRPAHAIAARCPSAVAAKVLARELSPELVGRHERVRALVRVDADHDLRSRFHLASPRRYDRRVAVAVGRTCLSRETDQAPMKSRPAALRHPAGGMTSNGHDQPAGQHGNEPTRRAHHRTVSLTHGNGQSSPSPLLFTNAEAARRLNDGRETPAARPPRACRQRRRRRSQPGRRSQQRRPQAPAAALRPGIRVSTPAAARGSDSRHVSG